MEELQLKQFVDYLTPRKRDAHKGDFGHLLIVGGDYGFSGAVLLAALAALRIGAGLVSVATRADHAKMLNLTRPEIMCHAVSSFADLRGLLEKATTVLMGPGLGQSGWSQELFSHLIECEQPLILDADGLNLLAKKNYKKNNWVLTPHAGEAGRLLNKNSGEIQADRLAAVKQLQQKFGGWVVLKGAGSLIAGPDELAICTQGNPGMATGGMGDVLSGVLGGLIAQKIPFGIAIQLGVLVHAMAGDLAAKEGERGMIASDLMPYLRKIVNKWS
jgi:hydroxyethylthiazole kinase-like uncharacterized protein yjeF